MNKYFLYAMMLKASAERYFYLKTIDFKAYEYEIRMADQFLKLK